MDTDRILSIWYVTDVLVSKRIYFNKYHKKICKQLDN